MFVCEYECFCVCARECVFKLACVVCGMCVMCVIVVCMGYIVLCIEAAANLRILSWIITTTSATVTEAAKQQKLQPKK